MHLEITVRDDIVEQGIFVCLFVGKRWKSLSAHFEGGVCLRREENWRGLWRNGWERGDYIGAGRWKQGNDGGIGCMHNSIAYKLQKGHMGFADEMVAGDVGILN